MMEGRVVVVGYVDLGGVCNLRESEISPSFSIEEELPVGTEGDESIVIHVHTTRGASFATHIILALFRALIPEAVS